MLDAFKTFCDRVQQTGRLMVGVPDYVAYEQHMELNHPDKPKMTYEQFFRERQMTRYSGARIGRCC